MEEVSAFAAYSSLKKPKMQKNKKHFDNTKNSFPKKKKNNLKKTNSNHAIHKRGSGKPMLNGSKSSSDSGSEKQAKAKNAKKTPKQDSKLSNLHISEESSSSPDNQCLETSGIKKSKRLALKNNDANIKKIKISQENNKIILPTPKNDSINDGIEMFKWLIFPIALENFFNKFWEKAPFVVERNDPKYYSRLISFEIIDKMLLNNHIEFTKNIDITTYKNGIRETLNPEGRAMPGLVWEKYEDGCSIRLLNPQTFIPAIFTMNTTLQEYFHCMVGANVYLTPPNSQGFAPHYDDIEAFVLQIEGKKLWRLYNPRNKNEELPRVSSGNFQQDEIGEPILEKVLQPGDIMYFPRGTIHQAYTEPGYHSLHITLSVYQRQSYADLFEKLLPIMLRQAIDQDVDLRRGLPLNIWNNLGIVHADVRSKERSDVFAKCRDLLARIVSNLPIDEAVDQVAKKFQNEALPPDITPAEKCRTIFGSRNTLNRKGRTLPNYEFNLNSRVRLLRANILRLVQEDDAEPRIYYYADNSKEYQEYEPNFIEIDPDDTSAIDILVKAYPDYVYVKDMPLEGDEKKIITIQGLWERGLLMLSDPISMI